MRPTLLLAAVTLAATTVGGTDATAACTTAHTLPADLGADVSCVDVHPGTRMTIASVAEGAKTCTAGFLYGDGAGNRYVAVPGDCIWDPKCLELVPDVPIPLPVPLPQPLPNPNDIEVEDLVCLATPSGNEKRFTKDAPVAYNEDHRRLGVLVYGVDKVEASFGLVKLDRGVAASPAVPYFGGPTAAAGDSAIALTPVQVVSPRQRGAVPHVNARVTASLGWQPTGLFSVLAQPLGPALTNGGVVLTTDGRALGQIVYETYLSTWRSAGVRPITVVTRSRSVPKLTLRLLTAPVAG